MIIHSYTNYTALYWKNHIRPRVVCLSNRVIYRLVPRPSKVFNVNCTRRKAGGPGIRSRVTNDHATSQFETGAVLGYPFSTDHYLHNNLQHQGGLTVAVSPINVGLLHANPHALRSPQFTAAIAAGGTIPTTSVPGASSSLWPPSLLTPSFSLTALSSTPSLSLHALTHHLTQTEGPPLSKALHWTRVALDGHGPLLLLQRLDASHLRPTCQITQWLEYR